MFNRTPLVHRIAFVLAGASALALAGCSGPTAEPTDGPISVPGATETQNEYLDDLYQSAISSGKTDIVIYGPSVSTSQPLFDAFTERFPGLRVVPQEAPDAQTVTKLEAEAQSDTRIADLFTGGGPTTAQVAAEPGICTQAEIVTGPDGFEVPYSVDGRVLNLVYRYFSIVYNTDEVSASEAPTSWEDLLDPKWKGRIVIADPTIPGGVRSNLVALLRPETEAKWGVDYLQKLYDQDLILGTSESAVPSDVPAGRGDIGIAVYSGYYAAAKAKGAPLDIVFPLDNGGTFFTRSGVCYIEDAPHADAALLYLNWLFTEEGQQAIADKDNAYGLVPGSPGPAGAAAYDDLDKLPISSNDPEFNQPFYDIINGIFGK